MTLRRIVAYAMLTAGVSLTWAGAYAIVHGQLVGLGLLFWAALAFLGAGIMAHQEGG